MEDLFELGKYVEWRPNSKNLFGDDHDNELFVVDCEFLLYLIEQYRQLNFEYFNSQYQKIESLYKSLIETNKAKNQEQLDGLVELVLDLKRKGGSQKFSEWGSGKLNCLSLIEPKNSQVTTSWLYEYSIFNLVYILHTFDWNKNNLIYYGT